MGRSLHEGLTRPSMMIVGDQEVVAAPILGAYRLPNTLGRGNDFPAVLPTEHVAKFHGNLTIISAPKDGEVPGRNGFTPRQMAELDALEVARHQGNLELKPLEGTSIGIFTYRQSAE